MLINCVAYEKGHRLADISVEAISDYLTRPECFVWVALKDATPEELSTMQGEFGLHPLAVEDARHKHQRAKIEEYERDLFVVAKPVEMNAGELVVGEVAVFVGKNFVLSVRSGMERGFQDVRDRCQREPELLKKGSGFVLYALLDAIVDRYFPVIEALQEELEALEAKVFNKGSPRAVMRELYGIKSRLVTLRQCVTPLLDAVGHLHSGRVPVACQGLSEYFRDVYDHLARIDSDIESLRDMHSAAMQISMSQAAIESSEVSKKLAAWAAMIATPTLMAGVWGMNFKHMPELEWTFGYPLALTVMACVVGVLFWRFKRARWL